jgi:hypothetical protein
MKYKWARAKLSFFGIYKVCELVWKRVKKIWIKKGYLWWKQSNFNQYMKNNKIII